MFFRFMAPLVSFPQSLLSNLIGSGDLLEFLLITALGAGKAADSGGGEGHGHWSLVMEVIHLPGKPKFGALWLEGWKLKALLFLRVVYLQKF